MHPVILRLIAIKWQLFGKYHSIINTAFNLLYTLLWTTLGVTLPKTKVKNYYTPMSDNVWRIVLEIMCCGMSLVFIIIVSSVLFLNIYSKLSKIGADPAKMLVGGDRTIIMGWQGSMQ